MTGLARLRSPRVVGAARVLAGSLFFCHGAQLVLGAFGGPPPGASAMALWIAGPLQVVTGALIAVGVYAEAAAFVASGLMAFAYFIVHAPRGFWPIENGGELAILYCWIFLLLAADGPGAWAVGHGARRR